MKNKEILEIINKMLSAKSPININGEIDDLNEYEEIFSDGQWSNEGCKYFYNSKTHSLIYYEWNKWQGSTNTYQEATLEDYINGMLNQTDEKHFDRYIDGLKKIFKLLKT